MLPSGLRHSFKLGLFLGVSLYGLAGAYPCMANPQDGVVVQGAATFDYQGAKLDVFQHSDRAVIDWRSFNIAPDEHTQFHQPSSSSTVLNRVTGGDPSQILGRLTANGNVILVNPNGVFFGKDSRVDVNGLIATSGDIRNDDFINGQMIFSLPGHIDAAIVNEGTITAAEAGLVGLVAPRVENSGHIVAKLGRVELAAGDSFVLDFHGDGLLGLDVGDAVQSQSIRQNGKIEAEGGVVVLSAAAGRGLVDNLIEVKGEVRAPVISSVGGKIIISAQAKHSDQAYGIVSLDGAVLDVSGRETGQKGGTVTITGDAVITRGGTHIDASGDAGGGQIFLGGDYLGQGDIQTARLNIVEDEVVMRADALSDGDGGKVVVWADKNTYFSGTILAKGGANSGDGGFVEVSGKEYLRFNGSVDTSAQNGSDGLLFLDPANIVIQDGSGDGAADGTTTFSGNPSATVGAILAGDAGPSVLYRSELEGIAGTTNISIAASNSITINNMAGNAINFAQTGGRSVSFTAGAGGITMLDTNDVINTAGAALNFTTSDGGGVTLGGIGTNGGLLSVNVDGDSQIHGAITGAGGLTKSGAGSLTLRGNNSYSGTTTLAAGAILVTNDNALGSGLFSVNAGSLGALDAAVTLSNAVRLNGNLTVIGDQDLTFDGIVTNHNGNRSITFSNTGMTTFSNSIHLSQNTTNRTLTLTGAGNAIISGSIIKGGGGTDASNLSKSGTGNLYITGTSSYTGTTTLSGSGTLFVDGQSSLGGNGLIELNGGAIGSDNNITLSNNIRLSANSRIAGTGDLTLSGVFTNFDGSRTLTINNTGLTTMTGVVALSNNTTNRTLTIAGAGDLVIDGQITDGASTNSGLTKTGTGTLTLNNSNTYSNATTVTGGNLALGNVSALGTSLLILNGGTLLATSPLTVANNLRISANSTIAGDEDLTFTGILTNFNGNRTLSVENIGLTTFDGDIHLSNNTTNRTLTLSGNGNIIINGDIIKGGGGTDASSFVKAGDGTLVLNGNGTYTGSTTINGGILRIGNSERVSNNSSVTIGGAGILDLNGHSETVATVTNNGTVRMGTGGSLITTGAQNHTNGIIEGINSTLSSTGGGAITASNSANQLSGWLDVNTTGAVNVVNDGTLTLRDILGSTILAGSLNGDLNVIGQVVAQAATGISMRLYTQGIFTNTYGASALSVEPGARYLVFSNDSTADTRGGLTGFNRYGCAYNAGAPSCAAGTDIPGAGSGFYFASAPVLTVSGFTVDNKVYDSTDTGTISGVPVLDGVLNGDSIGVDDLSVVVTFDNKDVGAGKAVAVSGFALTGLNHGYILQQPTGLTADITALDLLISGLTANSRVYDGTTVATLSGTATIAPLGIDDVVLQGTASADFTDRAVGTGKSVLVTGLSLSGVDAGNYNLLMPTGLTADISQRPLTVASFSAANKIFDGNTNATVSTYFFDNGVAGDSIFLNNFTASFDTPDIGTNKTVTLLSADFEGSDAIFYAFTFSPLISFANIEGQPNVTQESLLSLLYADYFMPPQSIMTEIGYSEPTASRMIFNMNNNNVYGQIINRLRGIIDINPMLLRYLLEDNE